MVIDSLKPGGGGTGEGYILNVIASQSQANSPFSGTHSNSNSTFQGTTQSNVSDIQDEGERPKKKAKSSSKPSKSSQLKDKMASALDLMI
ncbi:hypothetical protein AgCh_033991 [Apium graveolens]